MSETPRTVEQWREDERREAVEDEERDEERLRFEPDREPERPADDTYPPGEPERIGATLATVYREEAAEIALGHGIAYRTCACGRSVKSLEHDGECRRCAGLEPEDESARRREGRRRLHRATAMLLRRIGHPERAAWYETEAERE